MTPIIAGRFEQGADAERAAAALRNAGFAADDVTVFFVNPPGQHDTFPIGGDRDESPGAKHAEGGAAAGVAVGTAVGAGLGLAAAVVLGPAAVIAGAGAGAYAGSLAGALGDMKEKSSTVPDRAAAGGPVPPPHKDIANVRRGGMMVAVRAGDFAKRVDAVNVLRSGGAEDIERADGTWAGGHWSDFDPLKPVLLVDLPASEDVESRK
jgi:hypothetical protein